MKYLIYLTLLIISLLITNNVLAETLTEHIIVSPKIIVVERKLTIEEKIQSVFNNSRMVKIAQCESGLKQFKNNKPLLSPTSDVGVMQINMTHWARAKRLGLDIFYSVDDNIKMGKIIYDEQGINAWSCNKIVV